MNTPDERGIPRTIKAWKDLEFLWAKMIPERMGDGVGILLDGEEMQAGEKALALAQEKSKNVLVVHPDDGSQETIRNNIKNWLEKKGIYSRNLTHPFLSF